MGFKMLNNSMIVTYKFKITLSKEVDENYSSRNVKPQGVDR